MDPDAGEVTRLGRFIRCRRGRVSLGAATIAVCVLFGQLARLLNGTIGYANSINCDSWYFLGLQLDYKTLYDSHLFYQAVRFPALLPWSYLGPWISYDALNALKFLTYFTITCAGFVWFSARLYGLRVAVLTTVLFCCSTSFLGVLSHDYLTGAGLVWISLFLGATVEAARSRFAAAWSVASGFFFGLCIYTHLPTILFVWAIPLLFFARHPRDEHRGAAIRVVVYASGSLAGFVAASLMLGLYSHSLGGRFFYLGQQIDVARNYVEVGGYWDYLWRSESINGILFIMFAGSGLLVGTVLWSYVFASRLGGGRQGQHVVLFPALVCFLTIGFLLAYQLSGRFILNDNGYSPWVYPTLFAGVGALLSRVSALRTMSWPLFGGAVAMMFGILLVAAMVRRTPASDGYLFNAMLASGLAFLSVVFVLRRSRWGAAVLIPLTCLMVASFPTTYGSSPWYIGRGSQSKAMTLAAVDALRIYRDLGTGERPAFWVSGSEPQVVSVPRSFLYCSNFPGSFPGTAVGLSGFEPYLLPFTRGALEGHKYLVVVATGSGLAPTATAALWRLGIRSTLLGEWPIGSGELQASMAVLRMEAATE